MRIMKRDWRLETTHKKGIFKINYIGEVFFHLPAKLLVFRFY